MSKLRDFSQLPNILFDMDLLSEDSYLVGFLRFWRHYATRKENFRGSYRKLANLIRMPKSCVARMVPEWERAGFVTKETKTKEGENREEMVLTINVEAFWEFNYAYYPERPKLGQQNIIVSSNIPSENNNVPNWDSNVPPRDNGVPDWDKSVPRASTNSDVILGNTTVISGNTEVTNSRVSIDNAALSQLQNENALLKAQIAQLLQVTDPPKGSAYPTTAGRNASNQGIAYRQHLEHSFIRLDNLEQPTVMIVTLTPAFPHPFYSEMEDKRRERVAAWEVLPTYKKQGLEVEVRWEHEVERQTVDAATTAIVESTAVVGGNTQSTPTDHNATQSPTIDEKQGLTQESAVVAHQKNVTPESPLQPQETPSSTQAVKDLSNQATEQEQQASGNSYSPPMATKKPSKSTGSKGKGKQTEINEVMQKRVEKVYEYFDKLKQEVMQKPDARYRRTGTDTDAIIAWLDTHPTEEILREVYLRLWNTPVDKRTNFSWKKNMWIHSVLKQYETMEMDIVDERNKQAKRNVVPAGVKSTFVPPVEEEDDVVFVRPSELRKRG